VREDESGDSKDGKDDVIEGESEPRQKNEGRIHEILIRPNRNAVKSRLKYPDSMSRCRSEADRWFQILGPATEKLLSPSQVFVLGTVRTLA